MSTRSLPATQRELLLAARGNESQGEFARRLGIDRTCLSRYERERLGVPTAVLNHCLQVLAGNTAPVAESPFDRALLHVRQAADALQELSTTSLSVKRTGRR